MQLVLPAGWYRAVRTINPSAPPTGLLLHCLLYNGLLLYCFPKRSRRTDDQTVPNFVLMLMSSVNIRFLWCRFYAFVTRAMQRLYISAMFAVWHVT